MISHVQAFNARFFAEKMRDRGLFEVSDEEISALQASGWLASMDCLKDTYAQAIRPPYLVARNQFRCAEARRDQFGCQFEDLSIPPEVARLAVDLDLSQEPAAIQLMIAFLLYPTPEMLNDPATAHFLENYAKDLVQQADQLKFEYRETRLINRVIEALSRFDHIILPWGLSHSDAVARGLRTRGFDLIRTRKILVGSKQSRAAWPMRWRESLDSIIEDYAE